MSSKESSSTRMSRRESWMAAAGMCSSSSLVQRTASGAPAANTATAVTCFIRYQIDPFQLTDFRRYAEKWGQVIPRCGGHLIGYFLPHEGTNDIAWGLIGFDSLASYERYRLRLKEDADARENFQFAQSKRLVLREERTFLEAIPGVSSHE